MPMGAALDPGAGIKGIAGVISRLVGRSNVHEGRIG